MAPAKESRKVWNEDLVTALRARGAIARLGGKRSVQMFMNSANIIEAVRQDIYQFKSGRIVGLPTKKLCISMDNLCRKIIDGSEELLPAGYIASNARERAHSSGDNPFDNYHYLKNIKVRGGAFAILLAFHCCGDSGRQSMTKAQLCQAAQPFCDEAMEANWHAGRQYGAWKSNETLLKHNLISVNRGRTEYNAAVGGFRTLGSNSYILTREGELFIEALKKRHPNVFERIDRNRRVNVIGGMQANSGDELRRGIHTVISPAASPVRPSASGTSSAQADRCRLLDWIQTADVGQTIEFSSGKDRRRVLHNLCDEINNRELQQKGRRLLHYSEGSGRARKLCISLQSFKLKAAPITNTAAPVQNQFSDDDDIDLFNTPQSPTTNISAARLTSSGKKRSASSQWDSAAFVPAREAAAMAAFERQAIFESIRAVQDNKDPARQTVQICESDADEEDVKIPALPRKLFNRRDILEIFSDDDDDDDDELLLQTTFKRPAAKCSNDVEIVDLTQETKPTKKSESTTNTPKKSELSVLIDNRERSRNCQPRYLRTELTRILNAGPVELAWPQNVPSPSVVEEKLSHGDFCFQVTDTNGKKFLPVCVERKRVGDLVQRSTGKDHWHQLQHMRDSGLISVFLIEGDFRTAAIYEPFSPQRHGEDWSAANHTVDDEDSLLRFIFRAVFSTELVRFVQTKDEQESLRAVAALGLVSQMSSTLSERKGDFETSGAKTKQMALADGLEAGGVPWQLARAIAQEVGSKEQLDMLYSLACDEECRSQLLVPIIQSACSRVNSDSSVLSWSDAIHRVYYSPLSDVKEGERNYIDFEHLVSDRAALLKHIHSGKTAEEALEAALSPSSVDQNPSTRHVFITLPEPMPELFPDTSMTSEKPFYSVKVDESLSTPLLTTIMQASDGRYECLPLYSFLIEGSELVELVQSTMMTSTNSLQTTRIVAKRIFAQCPAPNSAKRVLLVRGLRPALDRLAKSQGYRPEIRFVIDMLFAELMTTHNLVILQAIRKKGDWEKILLAMAMACFNYALLVNEDRRLRAIYVT